MSPRRDADVLLDAYAVLAVLRGEPAAAQVKTLVGQAKVEVHPLNLAEVLDRLARLDGVDADDVEADVALLGFGVASVDGDGLIDAGRIRARYYHRSNCAVSLADCVAAAHCSQTGFALATSDPALAEVAQQEAVTVHPLPDSTGKLPF